MALKDGGEEEVGDEGIVAEAEGNVEEEGLALQLRLGEGGGALGG